MIADAAAAMSEIFTPAFRAVLWKILILTVALLVLLTAGLHHFLLTFVHLAHPWLRWVISVLTGLGLVVGSIFLVAPISALIAGFFVDDLAARVEQDIDPFGQPGRALPLATSVWLSLRFAVLSLAVTVMALILLFVPGFNAIAFVAANTYLLGRQYFEFASLRFRSVEETRLLRRRHWPTIMLAGLCIAAFVSVPLLNLLTPLFGTALMVRVHKRLDGRTPITLAPL